MIKSIAVVLFATSMLLEFAQASTKYEKIKELYESALAPSSEQILMDSISRSVGCAEFNNKDRDTIHPQRLNVISHTIKGGGTEFPDQTFYGVGFIEANYNTEDFFKNYSSDLSQIGYRMQYNYIYFGSEGDAFKVKDSGIIRLSSKYILFQRDPDKYGYCWF